MVHRPTVISMRLRTPWSWAGALLLLLLLLTSGFGGVGLGSAHADLGAQPAVGLTQVGYALFGNTTSVACSSTTSCQTTLAIGVGSAQVVLGVSIVSGATPSSVRVGGTSAIEKTSEPCATVGTTFVYYDASPKPGTQTIYVNTSGSISGAVSAAEVYGMPTGGYTPDNPLAMNCVTTAKEFINPGGGFDYAQNFDLLFAFSTGTSAFSVAQTTGTNTLIVGSTSSVSGSTDVAATIVAKYAPLSVQGSVPFGKMTTTANAQFSWVLVQFVMSVPTFPTVASYTLTSHAGQQATLNWTVVSGGPTALNYTAVLLVIPHGDTCFQFTSYSDVSTGSGTSTYTFTGLTPTDTYCAEIAIVWGVHGPNNAFPGGSYFGGPTVTPGYPAAPTVLAATVSTLSAISFSWTAPVGNVLNYTFEFGATCGALSIHRSVGVLTTYTVTGLAPSQTICAAVVAWNSTGAGAASISAMGTTLSGGGGGGAVAVAGPDIAAAASLLAVVAIAAFAYRSTFRSGPRVSRSRGRR